jgi:hypothetical protein
MGRTLTWARERTRRAKLNKAGVAQLRVGVVGSDPIGLTSLRCAAAASCEAIHKSGGGRGTVVDEAAHL